MSFQGKQKQKLSHLQLCAFKAKELGVQANPGKGTAELSGWHSAPGAEGDRGCSLGTRQGGSTPTSTPHSIPPPRPAASGDHQRQPETALRGAKTLSRPPGLTILSRSSPLAWSIALHVLLPGRGADRRAAWPRRSRGGAAGRTRPFPLAFQKAEEKKKKNGSRSRTGEGAQGQGPGQPGDGGGSGEGDPSKRGKRGLQSEKEAAGETEAGALRLTKPAEGAALWLPVLRAPPREPRSPAAPSGSPAPPPLWEATWTSRFGPSAKSRLQGGGSPPPRPGSPAPLRPMIGGSQCAECR